MLMYIFILKITGNFCYGNFVRIYICLLACSDSLEKKSYCVQLQNGLKKNHRSFLLFLVVRNRFVNFFLSRIGSKNNKLSWCTKHNSDILNYAIFLGVFFSNKNWMQKWRTSRFLFIAVFLYQAPHQQPY
jgi:hypothetical protein